MKDHYIGQHQLKAQEQLWSFTGNQNSNAYAEFEANDIIEFGSEAQEEEDYESVSPLLGGLMSAFGG